MNYENLCHAVFLFLLGHEKNFFDFQMCTVWEDSMCFVFTGIVHPKNGTFYSRKKNGQVVPIDHFGGGCLEFWRSMCLHISYQ